jgi:hypothetical protein
LRGGPNGEKGWYGLCRRPGVVCDGPELIVSSARRKARARPADDSRHSRRVSWKPIEGLTMRLGTWRALPLALALAAAFGLGVAKPALADGLPSLHTIPREVPAYDFTTGGPYKAPPVPYGHYAKDYIADADKALGCLSCKLHGLGGGGGLFHHGDGDDQGGHGHHGNGCGNGACADSGTGYGSACGTPGCFGGISCGLLGHKKAGVYETGAAGFASTYPGPSSQAIAQPSAQSACGQTGCTIGGRHGHGGGMKGCGLCGGRGCHSCGGIGASGVCGDPGCGHGQGTGCSLCGGKGCKHCMGGAGLGSMLHGKLASLTGAFHRQRIKWFVGAGGPVPLTPGYVPYIVTTRSPRDFFAFAPMNPNDR